MSIERLIKAYALEKKYLDLVAEEMTCPVSVIDEAEVFLEVKFPPTYRYFLEHIYLNSNTCEMIWGIDHRNNKLYRDSFLIMCTLDARRDPARILPPQYIVVEEGDSLDFSYVLDTTRVNEKGECPVISWGIGEELGGDFEDAYPDFDRVYLEILVGYYWEKVYDSKDRIEAQKFIQDYLSAGFKLDELRNMSRLDLSLERAIISG